MLGATVSIQHRPRTMPLGSENKSLRAEFLRLETAQNVVDNFWMRVGVEKFVYEFLKIRI